MAGQGDDYTTGCIEDYVRFKNYYKMATIDSSKQQVLESDMKAIKQINFTENPDQSKDTTLFCIIEEAKETILDFSKVTVRVL